MRGLVQRFQLFTCLLQETCNGCSARIVQPTNEYSGNESRSGSRDAFRVQASCFCMADVLSHNVDNVRNELLQSGDESLLCTGNLRLRNNVTVTCTDSK